VEACFSRSSALSSLTALAAPMAAAGSTAKARTSHPGVDGFEQLVYQRGHAEVAKAAEEEKGKRQSMGPLRCQNTGGGPVWRLRRWY
jgi:hypothetical protein